MISLKVYNNAMYKLILYFFLTSLAYANPTPYMVCLGKEESMIHKNKIGGAHYRLNRDMISALVQLRDSIRMREKFQKEVCKAPSASIKMLELIMSEDIFYSIHSEKGDASNYEIDHFTIDNLKQTSCELFITFVTTMQANLPKAKCLQRLVPELDLFFEKMQYILEDVGIQRVMDTIKDPKKTFKKLNMINMTQPKC